MKFKKLLSLSLALTMIVVLPVTSFSETTPGELIEEIENLTKGTTQITENGGDIVYPVGGVTSILTLIPAPSPMPTLP